jgi:hypothetical protein
MPESCEPLPSPLMGEGSGGGEDGTSSPPSHPSPAKGEGVSTYPCQPHYGGGARFKTTREAGSYDRYAPPTFPQCLTSHRAMGSVRGNGMAKEHGVEVQAVSIHLASPHDRVSRLTVL